MIDALCIAFSRKLRIAAAGGVRKSNTGTQWE